MDKWSDDDYSAVFAHVLDRFFNNNRTLVGLQDELKKKFPKLDWSNRNIAKSKLINTKYFVFVLDLLLQSNEKKAMKEIHKNSFSLFYAISF